MNSAKSHIKPVFSFALASILAFCLLDVGNRFLFKPDKFGSANKSWIWWAVRNFRNNQSPPDTVLLGSSLIIALQNDGDATYYNKSLDAVKHYKSDYIEERVHTLSGKIIHTASFAIGGQTASDAYAIFASMLNQQSAPKMLIWGVAPRDFVDRTYPHPEDTETVRYLTQVSSNAELVKAKNRTFWQKVESTLANLSSFYKQRGAYVGEQKRLLTNVVDTTKAVDKNAAFAKISNDPKDLKVRTPDWLLRDMNVAYGEDNVEGEWICRPFSQKIQTHLDNTIEYKQRYNPFHEDLYQNQLAYGVKLLKMARDQNTKVVMINMPLRKSNLSLMPAGIYDRYLRDIEKAAEENGALFINMNNDKIFAPADFWDPVHLNGLGSIKFINLLCKELQQAKLL